MSSSSDDECIFLPRRRYDRNSAPLTGSTVYLPSGRLLQGKTMDTSDSDFGTPSISRRPSKKLVQNVHIPICTSKEEDLFTEGNEKSETSKIDITLSRITLERGDTGHMEELLGKDMSKGMKREVKIMVECSEDGCNSQSSISTISSEIKSQPDEEEEKHLVTLDTRTVADGEKCDDTSFTGMLLSQDDDIFIDLPSQMFMGMKSIPHHSPCKKDYPEYDDSLKMNDNLDAAERGEDHSVEASSMVILSNRSTLIESSPSKRRKLCTNERESVENGIAYTTEKKGENPLIDAEERFLALCGDERQFVDCKKTVTQEDKSCHINYDDDDFYGMGNSVRSAVYKTFGIERFLDWQLQMLHRHIIDGKCMLNALVCAPTSAGKTLVAVVMLLRTMIVERKDAILALPYVAIVAEKVTELKTLASKLNSFTVAEYAGNRGALPPPKPKNDLRTLYVATNEKANILWKFLGRDKDRKNEVGLFVFDEFHFLGDLPRGIVLEEMVVGLIHWSKNNTKILAMSATVGNIDSINMFLGGGSPDRCIAYHVNKRPIVIEEHIVVAGFAIPILRSEENRGKVMFSDKDSAREVLKEDDRIGDRDLIMFKSEDDRVIAKLVFEAIDVVAPVLVFCSTRKQCVDLCTTLTEAFRVINGGDRKLVSDVVQRQREYIMGHLTEESKGQIDRVLLKGIEVGIGYHSAALHSTERKAVEEGFAKGIISVLCCTSTLAAGVNLPAARVIVKTPYTVGKFTTCSSYMQKIGRAGRGVDRTNFRPDSYILIAPDDVALFENMLEKHVEDVDSQLSYEAAYYKRQVTSKRAEQVPKKKLEENGFYSGVTRVVLSSLDMGQDVIKLHQMTDIYRLTLFYQSGEKKVLGDKEQRLWTLRPLLVQLKNLVLNGYLEMLVSDSAEEEVKFLISSVTPQLPQFTYDSEDMTKEEQLQLLSLDEMKDALQATDKEDLKEVITKNYRFRISPFAAATVAGSMSLQDGKEFVSRVDAMQNQFRLFDQLPVLYLSITEDMSKKLLDDGPYTPQGTVSSSILVSRKIAVRFDDHPDRDFIIAVGIDQTSLELWIRGKESIRANEVFNSKLARMWSALFVRDICAHPENFNDLCSSYGFDRGTALELTTSISSRCNNLSAFCVAYDKYWWYPALARVIIRKVTDAAKDELKPLLAIRHVTVERAKAMLQMGLTELRDVAMLDPPTQLCERVKYLSRWMAVEIALDARMQLSQRALELAAHSSDYNLILRSRHERSV